MTSALHRAVHQRRDAVAIVYRDRRTTWGALHDRVARLAAGLVSMGLQPGDRVGMLAANSDRYIEYMLAVWWAGGALNPVNTRWSPAEIAFSLDDCTTRLLLVGDGFSGMIEALRARSASLSTLVWAGDEPAPAGMPEYETLIAKSAPMPDAMLGGQALAGVFYTGGTTGHPKGVMLSHEALLSNALGCLLELNYADDDVVLAAAPIFHQAGMCILVRALIRLARMVVVPKFSALDVMRTVEREKVTFTLLVPSMIQLLVDDPRLDAHDMTTLQRIQYGGSPINESLLARAMHKLPQVQFYQGYGMTETGGPYTMLAHRCHLPVDGAPARLRSAGRSIWGMELRVKDQDGNLLAPGELGEVVCRGPGLMLGYWRRPDETAACLRDGWMHSGDAGFLDHEGYLFIVDRVKDMIVSGGENVYSTEVENAICSHPDVALCAVVGIPSERWGEAVHAIVVKVAGSRVNADDIRSYCKTKIAGYKCPRSVEFRDDIPMSGPGKPMKNALREPFWKNDDRRVG